jgi:epoxyqueuosine reductase
MRLNDRIARILRNEYVDYTGFADLSSCADQLADFGGEIVRGYKTGISIGIALPDSIVDHLENRYDINIACEYKTHSYNVMNDRLNYIASKVSSYLNQKGYRTLPIAASERTNEFEAIPTVSHKMIAHIAGLGWIGKNCLLITPDHGPRVRFVSILTNAPLKSYNRPIEQRCNTCRECMEICPVHAIKGVNFENESTREDRLDFQKCQSYFEEMKSRTKWNVCGLCLYVCPYGRG